MWENVKTNTSNKPERGRRKAEVDVKLSPDLETVSKIRAKLRQNPRDLLLFDLATRTGADLKAMLALKVDDLIQLKPNDPITTLRSKTDTIVLFSAKLKETFDHYLSRFDPSPTDFLFRSRKGEKPLTLSSASHLIKKWFTDIGYTQVSGFRSLHKIWQVHFNNTANQTGNSNSIDNLKPIKVTTAQEKVYKELFQAIVSGRIPPGEKIVTERIAKSMGVSQMPVREALYRLQANGFISIKKNRGSVVNELSSENLIEISKIRLVVESMAAREAARNCSLSAYKYLADIHHQMFKSGTVWAHDQFLSLNREFHRGIYKEARMPILLNIIDGLWDRVSPYLHTLLQGLADDDIDTDRACRLHESMLQGMKNHDPDLVEKYLKMDLNDATDKLIEIFRHMDR